MLQRDLVNGHGCIACFVVFGAGGVACIVG